MARDGSFSVCGDPVIFMRWAKALLTAALLIGDVSSSSATLRITDDRGGRIGTYLDKFAALRASGQNVVIDGDCYSGRRAAGTSRTMKPHRSFTTNIPFACSNGRPRMAG